MSCSFCSSRSHNIILCENPMIGVLYERIKEMFVDLVLHIPNDVETNFKVLLRRRYNLREMRAVGVRFMNASARMTKSQLIELMFQYFNTRIMNPISEPLPRVTQQTPLDLPVSQNSLQVTQLPGESDPYGPSLNDLILLEETISLIDEIQQPPQANVTSSGITWYIDRTPSPVSITSLQSFMSEQNLNRRLLYQLASYIDSTYHGMILNSMRTNLSDSFNSAAGDGQIKKYNIKINNSIEHGVDEGCGDCAICFDTKTTAELIKLNCDHNFCGICIKGILTAHEDMYKGPACALCRIPMTTFTVRSEETSNIVFEHCIN